MLNLKLQNTTADTLPSVGESNPPLKDSRLADYETNFDDTCSVEAMLEATKSRCQVSQFFIQALQNGRKTVLMTNLLHNPSKSTEPGTVWSLGRSSTCAIALEHPSISRCHAVIGYHPDEGLYISDLNSSNGTWVNRRRVLPMQRIPLQDGDIVRLGTFDIEFFTSSTAAAPSTFQDITRF
ncbi:MAG: FHA domain-containing protein [Cyanobacteriota bacterium]